MNYSFKTVIFAVVLGSLFTTTNIVKANDHYSAKSEILLAKGAEVNFANFMNENAKNFVKKEDWKIFTEIVTLYNASPSKFLKTSAENKAKFNLSVSKVEAKLSKIRGEEAQTWLKSVKVTAGVINFLWNNQMEIAPIETEELVAPQTIEMIGR
jgi:hypothetical protein